MHTKAVNSLRRRDKRLRAIIDVAGPCPLKPRRNYFVCLCDAIISQQLSMKAAATINRRFKALFPGKRPTPAAVAKVSESQLRSVGLSGQKSRYMFDLADKYGDGLVPSGGFGRFDDDAVIERLTQVKGVGVWTAQMFLLFVLNRPDVWAVGDLGLQKAVQKLCDLPELPDAETMEEAAKGWRPYRSVASWYLWRSLENTPAI